MYEMDRLTDPATIAAAATKAPPFGPGFAAADAERAAVLVIEATTVADAGADVTRWVLRDATDQAISSREVPGF